MPRRPWQREVPDHFRPTDLGEPSEPDDVGRPGVDRAGRSRFAELDPRQVQGDLRGGIEFVDGADVDDEPAAAGIVDVERDAVAGKPGRAHRTAIRRVEGPAPPTKVLDVAVLRRLPSGYELGE